MTNMWCGQSWLVVACVVGALWVVPSARAVPTALLNTLADTTICKTEVKYNVNAQRVPKIIKEVKCAASPQPVEATCRALSGAGDAPCCSQHSTPDVKFSCQEVIDTVQVQLNGEMAPQLVSIGCVCNMHRSNGASDA